MDKFIRKTAIVTGGASGIGRELCLALGAKEAIVIVTDINLNGAEAVAAVIRSRGGQASAVRADVSRQKDIREVIENTTADYGRLDYIFNNAGIHIFGELKDMHYDYWKKVIDINLWGVINGTTHAYEVMLKQGHGHIVNTASVSGIYPSAFEVAYTTTKFGVVGLSTSLREEAKAYNIKVSVVCPSVVKTAIVENNHLLKIDRDKILSSPRYKIAPSPEKAVRQILRGVMADKAIIPVNPDANIIWKLYRYAPSIALLYNKLRVKIGRKLVAASANRIGI